MTGLSPRDAIAVRLAVVSGSTTPVKLAEEALAALSAAGYSIVRTADVVNAGAGNKELRVEFSDED